MVSNLNQLRSSNKIWSLPQIQRYADDQFYAFTRGDLFFAFTNKDDNFSRNITYHPYTSGTRLCNIFDKNDNVTVNNNQFNIQMGGGNFKIYQKCNGKKNLKPKSKSLLGELYKKVKKFLKRYNQ